MPSFSSLGVAVRCDILICPFLRALSQDFGTVFDMAQGWLPASATRSLGWSLAQRRFARECGHGEGMAMWEAESAEAKLGSGGDVF